LFRGALAVLGPGAQEGGPGRKSRAAPKGGLELPAGLENRGAVGEKQRAEGEEKRKKKKTRQNKGMRWDRTGAGAGLYTTRENHSARWLASAGGAVTSGFTEKKGFFQSFGFKRIKARRMAQAKTAGGGVNNLGTGGGGGKRLLGEKRFGKNGGWGGEKGPQKKPPLRGRGDFGQTTPAIVGAKGAPGRSKTFRGNNFSGPKPLLASIGQTPTGRGRGSNPPLAGFQFFEVARDGFKKTEPDSSR